jgi:hypothetical protein
VKDRNFRLKCAYDAKSGLFGADEIGVRESKAEFYAARKLQKAQAEAQARAALRDEHQQGNLWRPHTRMHAVIL